MDKHVTKLVTELCNVYFIFIIASTEKNKKEWETILLNTLSIVLEEGSLNKQWCLELAEKMFEELKKTCENTKILTSEMFLIIKIISNVAASYDSEELLLTKKLLNFIFQSLLKMSYENSKVSVIYLLKLIIYDSKVLVFKKMLKIFKFQFLTLSYLHVL